VNDQNMTLNSFSLTDLQALAVAEDWEAVDRIIAHVANDMDFLDWAHWGMNDRNPHLRDLAVSLWEKTSAHMYLFTARALMHRMKSDDSPYVRYRAAFTLFRHGVRSPSVIGTIREAAEDHHVSAVAASYLAALPEQA
jgi:hypothetical protein